MAWKPEVQTDDSGKWYQNALAFATEDEAESNARDLMMRWMAVREYRAAEYPDVPVTHTYIDHTLSYAQESAEYPV